MNLKKSALILLGCFFIFPVLHASAADVAKIGILDLQRVLMVSKPGKTAQADLKKQGGEIEEDFKAKETEIRNIKERLEREALVMSREMRDEKEREYRIKINDFKMLQKKRLTELKELENRLVERIRDELMEIVEETGKKEGYLLIIDKAVAYYYPTAIDITDKIIQIYNNKDGSGKNSD